MSDQEVYMPTGTREVTLDSLVAQALATTSKPTGPSPSEARSILAHTGRAFGVQPDALLKELKLGGMSNIDLATFEAAKS